MTVRLSDSTDQVVRRDFFWGSTSSNATKDLQKAVRALLDAWQADEEIYKPLPPDGPRPPKAPRP
jgi:spore maturation protein CgeB